MNWQEFYKSIQEYYHIENEDTVIKIPFENILEVNEKELIYKNNDGTIESINLEDCVKNFNSAFGAEPQNSLGEPVKCVGGRYYEKPTPFYEFFTKPHHTRFVMTQRTTALKKLLSKIGLRTDSKDYSSFSALHKKLRSFLYATIDLT